MFVGVTHMKRLLVPTLRVWILVLVAMVFGQLNAAAHTHDDHDDLPGPVACDICLLAVSDDENDWAQSDAEPDPVDPPAYIIPTTLRLPDAGPAPSRQIETVFSDRPNDVGRQPYPTRAPPA